MEYTIHRINIFPGFYLGTDNPWTRMQREEGELAVSIARGLQRFQPPSSHYRNWTLYIVRVMATNSVGDSRPSAEMVARPQGGFIRTPAAVVNGATLTLRYDRNMDAGSRPDARFFVVLVNGGMRPVDSVSISGSEVRLILSSAVSSADDVTWLYQEPTDPTAPALRTMPATTPAGYTRVPKMPPTRPPARRCSR